MAAPGRGPVEETMSTGGSFADDTGAGWSRTSVNTVINTARAPMAPSAIPVSYTHLTLPTTPYV